MSSKLLKCINCGELLHPRADVYSPIDDHSCLCAGCGFARLEKAESKITVFTKKVEELEEISEYVCQNPDCGIITNEYKYHNCGSLAVFVYIAEYQMYKTRAETAEADLAERKAVIERVRVELQTKWDYHKQDDGDMALQILRRALALLTPAPATCTRTEDDNGHWEAECGGAEIFNDCNPDAHRVKYCQYCGRRTLLVPATEGEEGG